MALILVVEAEFAIAELLTVLIEDEGHQGASVANGRAGLRYLASRRPDLILTATEMPTMSGPEMAHALAREPTLCDIPLVVMSARPEVEIRGEYPRYAAYLAKPFRLTTLASLLSRLLPQR